MFNLPNRLKTKWKERTMKYLTILKTFSFNDIVQPLHDKETGIWNDLLNKHAKEGWRVINSGAVPSRVSEKVIFWALLEAPS
jgi:hypothetical protein